MKAKVYIETTIPSYLVARQSGDLITAAHQELTRTWWEKRRADFDLYVSEPVLKEAAGEKAMAQKRAELLASIPVLALTKQILVLAESLVIAGPIPNKAAGDALHIAVATVYSCEYLLTWNCRHIANAEIVRVVARLVRRQGFELPIICTPEELLGELA